MFVCIIKMKIYVIGFVKEEFVIIINIYYVVNIFFKIKF